MLIIFVMWNHLLSIAALVLLVLIVIVLSIKNTDVSYQIGSATSRSDAPSQDPTSPPTSLTGTWVETTNGITQTLIITKKDDNVYNFNQNIVDENNKSIAMNNFDATIVKQLCNGYIINYSLNGMTYELTIILSDNSMSLLKSVFTLQKN